MFSGFKAKLAIKLSKLLGLREETTEDLRARGVRVGKNVSNYGYIDKGHGFLVEIGDDVTISNARILAHDASTKIWTGYSKVGKVKIGSRVFIGAGAIVLPNVTIGDDVIIGAGSVVTKDIPNDSLVVGNPARVVGKVSDYIEKNRALMEQSYVGHKYWKEMTGEDMAAMRSAIADGTWGYDL